MSMLRTTSLFALLAAAALAAPQAKAATITFNIGDLATDVGGYGFSALVAVDTVGGTFVPGPATRVAANNTYGNLTPQNILPVALTDETVAFDFSLSKASTLFAYGAAYNGAPGVPNNYGDASMSLYDGTTLLGSDLNGNTAYNLAAGTDYSFLFDTKTAEGSVSVAEITANVTPNVSAVPLPPGLPMFGAALLGLVAVARGRSRGDRLA